LLKIAINWSKAIFSIKVEEGESDKQVQTRRTAHTWIWMVGYCAIEFFSKTKIEFYAFIVAFFNNLPSGT